MDGFLWILGGLIALPTAGLLLYVMTALTVSLPYHWLWTRRLPLRPERGPEALNELSARLRATRLHGWALVEAAQRAVAVGMDYSRRNSWDTPATAWRRGLGYCLQSAEALQAVLGGLGIPSELVQCTRNRFPPRRLHDYDAAGGLAGHAWLQVTLEGQTLAVCPGHPDNRPGRHHFTILGRVTPTGVC